MRAEYTPKTMKVKVYLFLLSRGKALSRWLRTRGSGVRVSPGAPTYWTFDFNNIERYPSLGFEHEGRSVERASFMESSGEEDLRFPESGRGSTHGMQAIHVGSGELEYRGRNDTGGRRQRQFAPPQQWRRKKRWIQITSNSSTTLQGFVNPCSDFILVEHKC